MSEVKRFICYAPGPVLVSAEEAEKHHRQVVFVLASDFDALQQRCRVLEHSLQVKEEFYQDALHSHVVLASQRDALRAEVERLRKDAELEQAIQRAAGELPDGWEIRICVERDYGGVDLIDQHGNYVDFATDRERLACEVADAIDAAMEAPR